MRKSRGDRVGAEVSSAEVEFQGRMIPGVCVSCTECNHEVAVGGTKTISVRRGLMLLREGCPEGPRNFYYNVDGDDDGAD